MTTGELKEMLDDAGYGLPVLVKTEKGLKRVFLAYRGTLGMKNTTPDNELEIFCIELVPPVEEPEPYFTRSGGAGLWWAVWRRDKEVEAVLVAYFSVDYHPNPKAAAEAECARLNAEYGKEQNNGNQ